MDRAEDIKFLQQYRATIKEYLRGADVPPTSQQRKSREWVLRSLALMPSGQDERLRRQLNEGKARAHALLTECGCLSMRKETSAYIPYGFATQQHFRLLDLLLDNQTHADLPETLFTDPIDEAIGVLKRPVPEHKEAPASAAQVMPQPDRESDPVRVLEHIARRFPRVVAQLTRRRRGRTPFKITDEYDAQDLFRALLQVDFDDVRPEEPVPSLAGTSTRIDFLLAAHETGVEVKMTRDGLDQGKVKDELLVDFANYSHHPKCKVLVAFVYDPDKRIHNPTALETELSNPYNSMSVHVFIVQN